MAGVPGSTVWLLSPEQLVALCEVLGIVELPQSRYVGDDVEIGHHMAPVGLRSCVIARYLVVDADDDALIEPHLAAALLTFSDAPQDAIALLSAPGEDVWVAHARDGRLVTLREQSDAVELRSEPIDVGLERLRRAAVAPFDGAGPWPEAETPTAATVPVRRWERLIAGGALRTSDDPLVARAIQATRQDRRWEATCLRVESGGGYRGEVLGWLLDDDGVILVEPDVAADDGVEEPHLTLRTSADPRSDVEALWNVLSGEGAVFTA